MNKNYTNNDELVHVGVKGMRWGVRRGQLIRKNTMITKSRQKSLDKRELSKLESGKGLGSSRQKKIEILKARIKGGIRVKPKGMSDEEFDKEYAKEIKSSIPKAKAKTKEALNLFGTKRLTYTEREQKRREVSAQLVKTAMRVVGGLLILDVVSGIGSKPKD